MFDTTYFITNTIQPFDEVGIEFCVYSKYWDNKTEIQLKWPLIRMLSTMVIRWNDGEIAFNAMNGCIYCHSLR